MFKTHLQALIYTTQKAACASDEYVWNSVIKRVGDMERSGSGGEVWGWWTREGVSPEPDRGQSCLSGRIASGHCNVHDT